MEHETVTTPSRRKRRKDTVVALIAHDAKKVDIAMFTSQQCGILSECGLIATGSAGRMISQNTGLEVKGMQSGPDGGDLQIGGLVASGEVDLVIFFRDPLASQPHEPDISALLRVCDVHNVPLANQPFLRSTPAEGPGERTRRAQSSMIHGVRLMEMLRFELLY